MPIYEYQCQKCGSKIEVMQRVSDPPLRKCRECSGKLEKLISRTSFQLKGGGWYSQGYSATGGKSSAGESASKSKSESKSDTKKDKDKGSSSGPVSATG